MTKIKDKIIAYIGVTSLLFLIIYGTIYTDIMRADFFLECCSQQYKYLSEKGLTKQEISKVLNEMFNYLKGSVDKLQVVVEIKGEEVSFFNDRELEHLADIRQKIVILNRCFGIMIITLSAIIFWFCRKRCIDVLFYALLKLEFIFFALLGILLLALWIRPADVIIIFHKLFFQNNLWILNPASDRLIWLFPTIFFKKAVSRLGYILGIVLSLFTIIAFGVLIYKTYLKKRTAPK